MINWGMNSEKAIYICISISFHFLTTNVFEHDDVFRSKHVAVKLTHSSVDCQSANRQLQALIAGRQFVYSTVGSAVSATEDGRANSFVVLKPPNCLGPWSRIPLRAWRFECLCLLCIVQTVASWTG
jgi:hypothetical protein